jgi:hypothetical protein
MSFLDELLVELPQPYDTDSFCVRTLMLGWTPAQVWTALSVGVPASDLYALVLAGATLDEITEAYIAPVSLVEYARLREGLALTKQRLTHEQALARIPVAAAVIKGLRLEVPLPGLLEASDGHWDATCIEAYCDLASGTRYVTHADAVEFVERFCVGVPGGVFFTYAYGQIREMGISHDDAMLLCRARCFNNTLVGCVELGLPVRAVIAAERDPETLRALTGSYSWDATWILLRNRFSDPKRYLRLRAWMHQHRNDPV